MKRALLTVKLLTALFILAVVAFVIWRLAGPYAPGTATGDSMPVRLAYVLPGDDNLLFAPDGTPAGETTGLSGTGFYQWRGTSTTGRMFLFDLPAGKEVFLLRHVYRPAGRSSIPFQPYSQAVEQKCGTPQGGRLYTGVNLPREYQRWLPANAPFLRWRTRNAPFNSVDVELLYLSGPRGPALATFIGPFSPGQKVQSQGVPATLSVSRYLGLGRNWGTWIRVGLEDAGTDALPVLIYDKGGKRRQVLGCGTVEVGKNREPVFAVHHMEPEEIYAITVGEEPKRRVFHNVSLFPKGLSPGRLSYKARLAKALETDEESAINANFNSYKAAMAVLDFAYGWHVQCAFSAIESRLGWNEDFAPAVEDKTRIASVAKKWLAADDPEIRMMGLKMAFCTSPWDYIRDVYRVSEGGQLGPARDSFVISVGENGETLSADQVATVREICEDDSCLTSNKPLLMLFLSGSDLPEATAALVDFVRDNRPWLWMRSLRQKKTIAALGDPSTWPLDLRVRHFIAYGGDPKRTSTDPAVRDEAAKLLPSLLTTDFALADGIFLDSTAELLTNVCDREVANRALVNFLVAADRVGQHTSIAASRLDVISEFNRLNGTDVGHFFLAGDDSHPNNMWALNLHQLADEIVQWTKTGYAGDGTSSPGPACPGDLRIICRSDKGDAPLISLWRRPTSEELVGGVHVETSPGFTLTYVVIPSGNPESEWDFDYQYNIRKVVSGSATEGLTKLHPPVDKDLGYGWRLAIEQASSTESVLSGTPVFDDWWAKYGAAGEHTGADASKRLGDTSSALTGTQP